LVKRILAMFAKYDRTVSFNNDGSYTVEVSYFSFQENVLIKDIISFGSQLVIESPKSIRDEMIKMLKSSDW